MLTKRFYCDIVYIRYLLRRDINGRENGKMLW